MCEGCSVEMCVVGTEPELEFYNVNEDTLCFYIRFPVVIRSRRW